jgi:raffinose/stachyose/melibiose transport system permease protein/xylobiose transport system permease protein
LREANLGAGLAASLWLLFVLAPVYFIVSTSLRTQDDYLTAGPVRLPESATVENYRRLWDAGFGEFIWNTFLVTTATVLLVLCTSLPAAYVIVRNRSRGVRLVFGLVLLGFAIPAQAVIVPIYLIITRIDLYDTLLAIILPTAAFSTPISVIVLTGMLREIPADLYEAMAVDGAGVFLTFVRLVVPLARPGLVTVAIFSGMSAWNGFLFPLVLTQSADQRVISLGLFTFQTQSGIDVPGLMAAVVLSSLPVFVLYLFGRRQLVRGLAAGYGK